MVVKDRNDDDQIVVCVQRDEKYRWDMINGIYMYKQGSLFRQFPNEGHNNDNIDATKLSAQKTIRYFTKLHHW